MGANAPAGSTGAVARARADEAAGEGHPGWSPGVEAGLRDAGSPQADAPVASATAITQRASTGDNGRDTERPTGLARMRPR